MSEDIGVGSVIFTLCLGIAAGYTIDKALQKHLEHKHEQNRIKAYMDIINAATTANHLRIEKKKQKQYFSYNVLPEMLERYHVSHFDISDSDDSDSEVASFVNNTENEILRTKTPTSILSRMSTPINLDCDHEYLQKELLIENIIKGLPDTNKVYFLIKELDQLLSPDIIMTFARNTDGEYKVSEFTNTFFNRLHTKTTMTFISDKIAILK